jgi:hypothetical protein
MLLLQRAKECKKLKDTTSTTLRKTKMAAERCKEEIEAERRAITQLKKDREDKMMEAERLRAQKQGSSKSTLRSLEVRIKHIIPTVGHGIPTEGHGIPTEGHGIPTTDIYYMPKSCIF